MSDAQKEYDRLVRKRRGRKPGRVNNRPIVRKFASTHFTTSINGQSCDVLPFEFVIFMLRTMVAQGHVGAGEYLEELEAKYSCRDNDSGATGHLVVSEPLDDATWIKKMEEENKYRQPPAPYLGPTPPSP